MDLKKIEAILRREGLLSHPKFDCMPLQGGVSSEIFLIKDPPRQFVVKKALPRLRVKDIWEADTSRNQVEQAFIEYVRASQPSLIPEILYSDPANGFFVMPYFDRAYRNWKEQLMEGVFEPETAKKTGLVLAGIHLKSTGDLRARTIFDTTENFGNLRIAPYLLTTASRNPRLKPLFLAEAKRLVNHRECLVHGDFSPKNILVGPDRMVLLDHEVAWYGDPAFDLGFMLTHLHLKQLVRIQQLPMLPDLAQTFWNTYFEQHLHPPGDLEERPGRLWLMIMLARVDGKSPVEYLAGKTQVQEFIRTFVHEALMEGILKREPLVQLWKYRINNFIKNENK